MDFISIRDTITGKTLTIIQQAKGKCIKMENDAGEYLSEPVEVEKKSVGKTMRTWMQLRMKDIG